MRWSKLEELGGRAYIGGQAATGVLCKAQGCIFGAERHRLKFGRRSAKGRWRLSGSLAG